MEDYIAIATILCRREGYDWEELKKDPYHLKPENNGSKDCNWYLDTAKAILAYLKRVG